MLQELHASGLSFASVPTLLPFAQAVQQAFTVRSDIPSGTPIVPGVRVFDWFWRTADVDGSFTDNDRREFVERFILERKSLHGRYLPGLRSLSRQPCLVHGEQPILAPSFSAEGPRLSHSFEGPTGLGPGFWDWDWDW